MMIFFKQFLYILFAALLLQGQPVPPFVIDQRLELVQLISDLNNSSAGLEHRDITPFLSLRMHEAVVRAKLLPPALNETDLFPLWILHFSPLPDLKPLATIPEKVRKLISEQDETALLKAIRDFAKQAAPILTKEKIRNLAHHTQVETFNTNLVIALDHMRRLGGFPGNACVLGAFMEGIPPSGFITLQPASPPPHAVLLFKLHLDLDKQKNQRVWAVPAVSKYYAESLLSQVVLPPIPEGPGRRWLSELQRVNRWGSPTWETHVRNSLAWALHLRAMEAMGNTENVTRDLDLAGRRMPWVPRLLSRWKELDQSPGIPTKMVNILPDLLKVFANEDPVVMTKIRMIGVRLKNKPQVP